MKALFAYIVIGVVIYACVDYFPALEFIVMSIGLVYLLTRPSYPGIKKDETIQEYKARKAEEEYQARVSDLNTKIQEELMPLVQRYGLSHLEEVLDHIRKKEIWTGAHKEEVRRILGKPYEIQQKPTTEDWCYKPSKNAKRFGTRIKFKGDRVNDYRI